MVIVPDFLIKRIYQKGSLKKLENGASITLKNVLGPGFISGFNYVKIIVSSGFDAEKIRDFEANNVPVDIYGVGTSLIKVNVGFTGDLVLLNGVHQAKEGRKDIPSSRLEKVDLYE